LPDHPKALISSRDRKGAVVKSRTKHHTGFVKAVAVFPSERRFAVIDHPEPTIASPTEVKLRMLDVGTFQARRSGCPQCPPSLQRSELHRLPGG
jgi:hypothetical protein